jgi:GTP-binding protein
MSPEKIPWEVYEAEFVTSAVRRSGYPDDEFPCVAFAGRSNVGKSSLLNSLVRRKRLAKTSQNPGLTQLVNFYRINKKWYYVDLPGYGYAKAPKSEQEKWRHMIEEFLSKNPRLKLLVILLDARHKPSELDDQLVDYLNHFEIPAQVVLTKSDKLKFGALQQMRKTIGEHYGLPKEHWPIATSAENATGREKLLQALYACLEEKEGPAQTDTE